MLFDAFLVIISLFYPWMVLLSPACTFLPHSTVSYITPIYVILSLAQSLQRSCYRSFSQRWRLTFYWQLLEVSRLAHNAIFFCDKDDLFGYREYTTTGMVCPVRLTYTLIVWWKGRPNYVSCIINTLFISSLDHISYSQSPSPCLYSFLTSTQILFLNWKGSEKCG